MLLGYEHKKTAPYHTNVVLAALQPVIPEFQIFVTKPGISGTMIGFAASTRRHSKNEVKTLKQKKN
jgi:hypothetical protein